MVITNNIGKSFDVLDRNILAALDARGRVSVSELARAVRHGRDLVAYRVKRFRDEGILRGVEPIIDPGVLGFGLYKTYLSFFTPQSTIDRLLAKLRQNSQVYCAARAHGRWDLMFNCVARSPHEFTELRSNVLSRTQSQIRELGFSVFTEMTYYSRRYLKGARVVWNTMRPRTESPVVLDGEGERILAVLSADAGLSDQEIALRADVTPMVLRTRLRFFEESRLILGYRTKFDRTAFGLSSYKLHISLIDHSADTIVQLRSFAASNPFVSQFMTQLGSWPCEMNVEAYDSGHLTEIIDDLRETLADRIGLVEVTMYSRDEFAWGVGTPKVKAEELQRGAVNQVGAVV